MRFLQIVSFATAIAVNASLSSAASVEQTIVYIECQPAEGDQKIRGTGVVVSDAGHVITAGHVLKGLSKPMCRGSIGTADTDALRRLIVQPVSIQVDAALLRFAEARKYDFVSVCSLEDWMVRRKVFIGGFPHSSIGPPSFREGVLSTVVPSEDGLIEIDAQSTVGMSGAPVFSGDLNGLIGIGTGVRFSNEGTILSYLALPLAVHAYSLGISPGQASCYHKFREVDLKERISSWKTGDGPVKLGVRAQDGICFLSGVWGKFDSSTDSVRVELQDGEYVLSGNGRLDGEIGAAARCMWFN